VHVRNRHGKAQASEPVRTMEDEQVSRRDETRLTTSQHKEFVEIPKFYITWSVALGIFESAGIPFALHG
jgi:hypothetical protein